MGVCVFDLTAVVGSSTLCSSRELLRSEVRQRLACTICIDAGKPNHGIVLVLYFTARNNIKKNSLATILTDVNSCPTIAVTTVEALIGPSLMYGRHFLQAQTAVGSNEGIRSNPDVGTISLVEEMDTQAGRPIGSCTTDLDFDLVGCRSSMTTATVVPASYRQVTHMFYHTTRTNSTVIGILQLRYAQRGENGHQTKRTKCT